MYTRHLHCMSLHVDLVCHRTVVRLQAVDLLPPQYSSIMITVLLLSDGPTKGYIWDMYVHSQKR